MEEIGEEKGGRGPSYNKNHIQCVGGYNRRDFVENSECMKI